MYYYNLVISLRRYRRGDHVDPPELTVSGCRACSRPVTLHTESRKQFFDRYMSFDIL
jgi:hypothetical protein